MARISKAQYDRRVLFAMVVYTALVLLLLPLARRGDNLSLQLLCSLLPVMPMLYLIWLTAMRILHSDELEQRTHLIGLGIASAIVAAFSLVGGFLAIAKVISLDVAAEFLIWVFPVMMLSYGAGRRWAARKYGSDGVCDEESMPLYLRLFVAATILAVVAVWAHWHAADDFRMGLLDGMAAMLAVGAAFFGLRRWWRRRSGATSA